VARNTAAQGAAFERRIITDLKSHGYLCTRAAASKGPVDIVAVAEPVWVGDNTYERDLLGVQAKLTDPLLSPDERSKVLQWALWAGAVPIVAHWAKSETTGLMTVHYRQLTGPGPREWAPWAPGNEE
jgi:Holliday junction resolvase